MNFEKVTFTAGSKVQEDVVGPAAVKVKFEANFAFNIVGESEYGMGQSFIAFA